MQTVVNEYKRLPFMMAVIGLLFFAVVCLSGCSHLQIENTTADGRTFKASGWSFLWDRNLEGLQFDYEKGTLDIINYESTPDKETIAKGLDLIGSAIELMKAAAK
jgi:hypothetical protein